MQKKISTGIKRYIAGDFIAALFSWLLFFIYRKTSVEHLHIDFQSYWVDKNFLLGGFIVSTAWIYFYALTNTYYSIYEKSRIAELIKTLLQSIIGCVGLFIIVMLDDLVDSYSDYYRLISFMFLTHFALTSLFRMTFLFVAKAQIKSGIVNFKTILVGNHSEVFHLYKELLALKPLRGITIHSIWTDIKKDGRDIDIPICALSEDDLIEHIQKEDYAYAILAFPSNEKNKISAYANILETQIRHIQVIPDFSELLSSNTKISNPIGVILLDYNAEVMAPWQRLFKRTFDVVVAICGLIVLSPFFLFIAFMIQRDSKGVVFYSQKRLGLKKKPFQIYKFRSMYANAENNGPQLSIENDKRITPIGAVMRKYRIDELPQLYNVLKGDMSLVGPRPERAYYAEQIIAQIPEYVHIYKVRPGITSWGMVRYGYASNLEQMLTRANFDLLYINSFSLLLDFRILIYTILTVVKGKGV